MAAIHGLEEEEKSDLIFIFRILYLPVDLLNLVLDLQVLIGRSILKKNPRRSLKKNSDRSTGIRIHVLNLVPPPRFLDSVDSTCTTLT